ncbi:ATP-binding protein [Tessaracoccus aquimaris]|uniref:ATP-binding protein n=1 Tax=Tessaracoccus aquimaris TaxID=1332264 RepID=A0A1Q2CPB0_9ACTN|nr:PhoH family protein [Tessaracoccus aquimaris]AQP47934.1 ATP-binding protein [Tessaracoccus aquimaris]
MLTTSDQPTTSTSTTSDTAIRTYVVDTSVLLSDPRAMLRFAEHNVILPIVVITELEAKRHHPELGYFARSALRLLDDLRVDHGRLDTPMAINEDGGNLRIELNHTSQEALPLGFRLGDNDTRILAVALNYANEGHDVVLVSKDLPLRVKAAAVGLAAEEYRNEMPTLTGYTGMASIDVGTEEVATLYETGSLDVESDIPVNSGVVVHAPGSSALGRVKSDGRIGLIKQDREVFGIRGRSAEQRVALDLLMDDSVGIVSLGGRAGTGKSALALCAGLEQTLEQHKFSKVMVFRPLYPVGGQDLGYLPGTSAEKMQPWGEAVFDTLSAVTNKYVIDELLAQEMIEVLPLTHIRGRSLHDAFVIVDEAQSLERNVLLTVLSRIGQNSRVVLTHDVAQRDNLRVGRHDGIVAVVEKLKGNPLFAHVTLTRSERSPIAALVTDLLEGDQVG